MHEYLVGFSSATNDFAQLSIFKAKKRSLYNWDDVDFIFHLRLESQFIPEYSFRILTIGYNVNVFPFFLNIEESIREDLSFTVPQNTKISIPRMEVYTEYLNYIFESARFEEIVSGVMKIARVNSLKH